MNHFLKGVWLTLCIILLPLFTVCKDPGDTDTITNAYKELTDLINQAEERFVLINWGTKADDFGVTEYWVHEMYKPEFRETIDNAKAVLKANAKNDNALESAHATLMEALLKTYEKEQLGTIVKKDVLKAQISLAEQGLTNAVISKNGFEHSSAISWVTQEAYNVLEMALVLGKEADNNPEPDYYEVAEALQKFTDAFDLFKPRPGLSELVGAISHAQDALDSVEISINGADVYIFRKWVTQAVYTTIETAIETAQSLLTNHEATKETVDTRVTTLNTALANFNAASRDGTLTAYIVTFDSNGGSPVKSAVVLPGGKVTEPTGVARYTNRELYNAILAADATGQNIPAGGYDATSVAVTSWNNPNGSPWNFATDTITANITLTAQWSTAIQPYSTTLTYTQAVVTGSDHPIVYVLRSNQTATGMAASSDVNVIFLGLGGQRTITLNNNVSLFNLRGNSSVTLGKDIKLTRASSVNLNASFILLTGASQFTMLDGSEISGVSSNFEGGIVMTLGIHSRPPASPNYNTAVFTMEGGKITGNSIGSLKFTWVSIIMVFNGGGKVVLKGGEITGNNQVARTDNNQGSLVPGKRVAAGDICFDQSIDTNIPFEISGNATVDFVYIGNNRSGPTAVRPYYFTIGSGWTGKINSLILCGLPGQNTQGWVDQLFVGPASGHTLLPADIDNILSLDHYPDMSDWEMGGYPTADLAPAPWRYISRGLHPTTKVPVTIGTLLELFEGVDY